MIQEIKAYLLNHKILWAILLAYGVLLVINAFGVKVWLPSCPFTTYLGVECMGCGINRATISVLQLNFKQAWEYNPLIFIYIPSIGFWISYDFYKYSKQQNNFSLNNDPNESI